VVVVAQRLRLLLPGKTAEQEEGPVVVEAVAG
jgi:hypothetical protein